MSDPNDRAQFAAALTEAMARRGVNKVALAEAVGTSASAIYCYRSAKILPTVQIASRLSDALFDGSILEMVVKMRTRSCGICGKATVDQGTKPRLFCSIECQRLSVKGVSTKFDKTDPRERAIAAMCLTCEPSGVCRTLECPLRAVSPLPFVKPEDIDAARVGILWTDERRARLGARFVAYWADPANREKRKRRLYANDEERREARRRQWREAKIRHKEKAA